MNDTLQVVCVAGFDRCLLAHNDTLNHQSGITLGFGDVRPVLMYAVGIEGECRVPEQRVWYDAFAPLRFKHWRNHRSTTDDLRDFSLRYKAVIRGWIEYYGKFWYRNFSYRLWSALQSRLLTWIKSKYRISIRQAEHRLRLVRRENPELFAHWYLLRASNV